MGFRSAVGVSVLLVAAAGAAVVAFQQAPAIAATRCSIRGETRSFEGCLADATT